MTSTDPVTTPHRGRGIALSAVWATASLFYFWTATSSGDPFRFGVTQSDPYNQLTDGFLHGELSVPTLPAKGLLALADPYDPYKNAAYVGPFHDFALYHGHYYLTWGPTPVITAFLPWRLLHIGDLPQNFAVFAYGVVGLAFALGLYELLLRRFLPRCPIWKATFGALALAFSNVMPYLLRRPIVYEVAISSGYCFTTIGLFFLAFGMFQDKRKPWALAIGSASLGLAVGGRFDLLLLGGFIVLAVAACVRGSSETSLRGRLRQVVPAGGPFAVVVVLVFAYNAARFGNPLEVGSSYQLAGIDPTKTPLHDIGYLAPSLYYYFLAPVRFVLAFPYFALPPPPSYPFTPPATYATEVVGGLLTSTPVLVPAAVVAVLVRRHIPRVLGVLMVLSVATAVVLVGGIALSVPGSTMRYEVDFATLLVLPAVLTWSAWEPSRRVVRAIGGACGALLVGVGVFVGLAVSIPGPDDELRAGNPASYDAIEQATEWFPTLLTKIGGKPEIVRIIDPEASYPYDLGDFGTYKAGVVPFTLLLQPEEIDIVSPSSGAWRLTATYLRTPYGPPKPKIRVYASLNGLERSFAFRPGRLPVLLRLHTGLNRLMMWVTYDPASAYTGPPIDVLGLYDAVLARPPTRSPAD